MNYPLQSSDMTSAKYKAYLSSYSRYHERSLYTLYTDQTVILKEHFYFEYNLHFSLYVKINMANC